MFLSLKLKSESVGCGGGLAVMYHRVVEDKYSWRAVVYGGNTEDILWHHSCIAGFMHRITDSNHYGHCIVITVLLLVLLIHLKTWWEKNKGEKSPFQMQEWTKCCFFPRFFSSSGAKFFLLKSSLHITLMSWYEHSFLVICQEQSGKLGKKLREQ